MITAFVLVTLIIWTVVCRIPMWNEMFNSGVFEKKWTCIHSNWRFWSRKRLLLLEIVSNMFMWSLVFFPSLFIYLYYVVCIVFQLVLWGTGLPQDLRAQHGKRCCHGFSLFHGPHRCHAGLLQSHVRSLWHGGLLPRAVGRPRSLDLLQHLPGHHEHYVDA